SLPYNYNFLERAFVANTASSHGLHHYLEQFMQGEGGQILLNQIRTQHRAVKRNQIGLFEQSTMQCCDITEAQEYLRVSSDCFIIQEREDSSRTVTSPQTKDRVNRL